MRLLKRDQLDPASRSERLRTIPFWVKFFGSGFFSGYFPFAPGTAGSLLAVGLYWFIPGFERWYILLILISVFLLIGIITASKLENALGRDPNIVVIDEIVGMWIALFLIPKEWIYVVVAFIVFRFFDIIKPPPARQFDQMSGGVGIMMDDVVAGIYANIITQLFLYFFEGSYKL